MRMRTVHAEPQWNFDSVSIFLCCLRRRLLDLRSRSNLQDDYHQLHSRRKGQFFLGEYRLCILHQQPFGHSMARLCVVNKRWGHNVKGTGEEIMI